MKKRLLSFLLSILLLFSVVPPSYAQPPLHDIVLVLDSSGSMNGTAITACKSAAIEFCNRVLSSSGNYRIGLVVFETDVTEYGFTNNMNSLKSYISDMYASGGTNMHDAVATAKSMLSSSSSPNKSIVIMADGIPEHGKQKSTGRYTSSDSNVYQQANAVYDIASSMHSQYNIYTLGFFHSIPDQTKRNFAKRFLRDLQNKGFYEASDAEELYKAFQEIVEVILVPPLDIKLSNKHTSTFSTVKKDNDTIYDFRHVYTITAAVTNTGTVDAENVKVKIEPAPGMKLESNEQYEKSLSTIPPNSTQTVTWTVRIEHKAAQSKYQYKVAAGADNAVGLEQFQTIVAPAGISSLIFNNKDRYTFAHTEDNFDSTYNIKSSDLNYLTQRLSNTEKKKMLPMLDNSFGGSCFGMSTVAILSKIGTIKPNLYQDGASSISQFRSPNNNEDVESLINFYHIMQKSDRYVDSIEKNNSAENLKEIEHLIENSTIPPLITFNWHEYLNPYGHAIIGCGFEKTTTENSPAGLDIKKYTKKINIYDVNSFGHADKKPFDIYYSSDYKSWTIPAYDQTGCWGFDIKNVTSDSDSYNPYKLDDYRFVKDQKRNSDALLTSNSITEELIIKNSTGEYSVSGGEKIAGNLDIWSYYDAMVLADNYGNTYSPQNYILPDANDDYSLEIKSPSTRIEFSMSYRNNVLTAEADVCQTADFYKKGGVGIKDCSGEFKLSSVFDEGTYKIPWHTFNISGSESPEISITLNKDGYILSGINLKNINIEAIGNDGTSTETITTTQSSLLVSMDMNNKKLTFFADLDNDGNYTNNVTSLVTISKNTIGSFFSNFKDKILSFFTGITNFFKMIYNMVVDFISNLFS